MKAQAHKSLRFPSGYKMILYVVIVAALGFLNCLVIHAADPENKVTGAETRVNVEQLVEVNAEADVRLEDWMFELNQEVVVEEDVQLEDWMLDFNDNFISETGIELENWMLDFSEEYVTEESVELEGWMLNFESWSEPVYFAEK